MDETKPHKPPLPGNHGQFGAGDASETYDTLQDHPAPPTPAAPDPATPAPKQTNAGERS